MFLKKPKFQDDLLFWKVIFPGDETYFENSIIVHF